MNLTAIIIAKNESEVIANALESVKFCDEIIVVDNNSSDNTPLVAQKFGAKVISEKTSNFSELRNFGKESSKSDFILYIDADEVVSTELRESILRVINSLNFSDAYKIKRKNFYLGKNEWKREEKMERLFYKPNFLGWSGSIHESPNVNGKIAELDGYLLHFTHRNLSQMLLKTIEWSDVEAKIRFDSNHPRMSWWRFPRVMLTTFINYYLMQKGYRLGSIGLIESIYQSYSTFITYAKLWEIQVKNQGK